MFQKAIALTLATAAFAGMISTAQAADPLHPSYYAAKAKAMKVIAGTGEAYVDSRNPLHPTFGRKAEWQMVAQGSVEHYIDSRNPLHPSFRQY